MKVKIVEILCCYLFTSLVDKVSPSQVYTLDTEEDLLDMDEDGNWRWSVSNCDYFETSDTACSLGIEDPENRVGFWTNCNRDPCSITYTSTTEEANPIALAFRIYAYDTNTSYLNIKTETLDFRMPINQVGWNDYSFLTGFNESSVTLEMKESWDYMIFDKVLIKTLEDATLTTTEDNTAETDWDDSTAASTDFETESTSTFDTSEASFPTTIILTESTMSTVENTGTSSSMESTTVDQNNTVTSTTEELLSTATSERPDDILDTIDDVIPGGPWVVDCEYAESISELVTICPNLNNVGPDPENNIGYWTPCKLTTCRIVYTAPKIENFSSDQQRQISFRSYADNDSQLSITTDSFSTEFMGTGGWMDIPFMSVVGTAETITITAKNGPSGVVVFDEIRVRTITGIPINETTITDATTTRVTPDLKTLSELYLMLILIAVGIVILLMSLLIIWTCLRRICCKGKRKRDPIEEAPEAKGDEFYRTFPVHIPSPNITPPPGFEVVDENGHDREGLNLQPPSFGTFFRPGHQVPNKPKSAHKNTEVYFRGSPPALRNQSYGSDSDDLPKIPRLFKSQTPRFYD